MNSRIFYNSFSLKNNNYFRYISLMKHKRLMFFSTQNKDISKDPVVVKYTNYFVNHKKEKTVVVKTNFGGITFDYEVHQKEPQKDEVSEKTEDLSSDLNVIDEEYFMESLQNIENNAIKINSNEGYPEQRSIDNQTLSNLNYVDKQYIVKSDLQNNIEAENIEELDKNVLHEIKKLEFIDSQYFEKNDLETASKASNEDLDLLYNFEDSLNEGTEGCTPVPKNEISSLFNQVNANKLNSEYIIEKINKLGGRESKILFNKNFNNKNKITVVSTDENINKDKTEIAEPKIEEDIDESEGLEVNEGFSAFDYVKEERQKEKLQTLYKINDIKPNEHYKKILQSVPYYSNLTKYDMLNIIKESIIYNKNDVLAINKPYGLSVQPGKLAKGEHFTIVDLLPDLAKLLKLPMIFPIHRLDKNTTGVLLFAKTQKMADTLKKMFRDHEIQKTYLAITKSHPDPLSGIINIPIAEGNVGNLKRMMLKPDRPNIKHTGGSWTKKAITKYETISSAKDCSFVKLYPVTGVKHQLRVHLSFAIGCPVLGDHKYTFHDKLAPQRLSSASLHALGIEQTKVRHLPLFLHASVLSVPGLDEDGSHLRIHAGLPFFYISALRFLRLSGSRNRHFEKPADNVSTK